MTEKDFIDKIDCKFPYDDPIQWKKVVKEGLSISDNAVFMIVHELARLPVSLSTQRLHAKKILEYLSVRYEHPLKDMIFEVARRLIDDDELSVQDVVVKMEQVRDFPGLYVPLNILYFSCNDKDNTVEERYEYITKEWRQKVKTGV